MNTNMKSGVELKVGHSYLARKGYASVFKFKLIQSTKISFKLKWENGNTIWLTKTEFDFDYKIIEDLGIDRLQNTSGNEH